MISNTRRGSKHISTDVQTNLEYFMLINYHWSTAKCYPTRKQSFLYAFGVLSQNLQSDFCYHV